MCFSHKGLASVLIAMVVTAAGAVGQQQSTPQSDEVNMRADRSGRTSQGPQAGGFEQGDQRSARTAMRDRMWTAPGRSRSARADASRYSPEVEKATDLIGTKIVDVRDADAGTVDDLVIDGDLGVVAYLVVARGGVLGMGERLVPVPFKAFRQSGDRIVLMTEKDILDHARAIEEDDVSILSTPQEAKDIHNQFSVPPYWTALRRMGPGEAVRSARRTPESEWPRARARDTGEQGYGPDVYGYGQPDWSEEEMRADRRSRSQRPEARRPAQDSEDELWYEDYEAARRDARERERERGQWEAEFRQDGRARESMADRDFYERERGYADRGEYEAPRREGGPSMWQQEMRGESPPHRQVRGVPVSPRRGDEYRGGGQAPSAQQPGAMLLVGRMIEHDLEGARNEEIGELEDLMVDMKTGAIGYAIVSEKGLFKDTLHAVPWDTVHFRRGEDRTVPVLEMTRRELEESPSFEKDNWPDMSTPRWAAQVYSYYGVEPSWAYYGYMEAAEEPTIRFNPQTLQAIEGTIEGMRRHASLGEMRDVVRLHIATAAGARPMMEPQREAATQPARAEEGAATRPAQRQMDRTARRQTRERRVTVYLSPIDYLRENEFSLRTGDKVTVKGSRVMAEGEPVLLATEITSQGKTLQVRNPQGEPLWTKASAETEAGRMREQEPGASARQEQLQQEGQPDQGQSNR